jgi:NADH:ubiquinone oxidoreductase subunit H
MWSFFFLGEYANMVTVSAIATTLFFGGWLRPFPNVSFLSFLDVIPGIVWFLGKIFIFMLVYIWFRGTFPRYRFDQLMNLGWKTLIPIALVNLVVIALAALAGRRGLQALAWILCGGFALAFVFITGSRAKAARAARPVSPAEVRT